MRCKHAAWVRSGHGGIKQAPQSRACSPVVPGHGLLSPSGRGETMADRVRRHQFSRDDRSNTMPPSETDAPSTTELEAAAFRRLVQHLRERTDVQNIDLMNLAGFCRNCMSRWYREAAEAKGIGLADPDAREIVYGMPYKEWQALHQKEATPEQK